MRRRWIVVLACSALAGCGSEPQLTAGTAERLHDAVAVVRRAAAGGDRDGALRALDRLERRVAAAERDGRLAEEDADALRRGVDQARARVREEIEAAPTPTATPEAEPPPAAEEEPPDTDEGPSDKGKGKDKKDESGKGKGKG